VGRFHAQNAPNGAQKVNGICIFDNSNGSLRLTERLAANFHSVVTASLKTEEARGNTEVAGALEELLVRVGELTAASPSGQPGGNGEATHDGWTPVIVPGAKAILATSSGTEEVTVLDHFYTPSGLQYHLQHASPTVRWVVKADELEIINGVTATQLYNVMTGELRQAA
jgi:hypothetical protein